MKLTKYKEDNKIIKLIEEITSIVFLLSSFILFILNKSLYGLLCMILLVSLLTIYIFGKKFSRYEKIWFISIMILASVFTILFPSDDINEVNAIVIMLLYLLDTYLNILCELLISKQSRINFIVSLGVEITEIIICFVLMYRIATLFTTLLFWIPIDIISFINWSKHKDDEDDDLTIVRKLKGYQEVLVLSAIVIWTLIVGYIVGCLDVETSLFDGNDFLEDLVIYLDACASAVGICNGIFIYLRLKEQWVAWYICALLELVINILSGQFILIILKIGYLTNTTYGYIRWERYIKEHN